MLRTSVQVGFGGAVTVAINLVALLIAVPIGIMAGELSGRLEPVLARGR